MNKFKLINSLLFLILNCAILSAQDFTEMRKLLRPDISDFYEIGVGSSVSIDGNIAIIGAPQGGANATATGMAIIYALNSNTNTWEELKRLAPIDGEFGDNFGNSVSISGDNIIIGSQGDRDEFYGSFTGSAYIFSKNAGGLNNWGQVKKILPSDPRTRDNFGNSVSISNDVVIIGSLNDDDAGSASGSAYVFGKNVGGTNNWGEVKKLVASDASGGDNFGHSVSISNGLAVVGAWRKDEAGTDSGAAYIFSKDQGGSNNWGEVKKLSASDGSAFDNFSSSVAISGSTVIIGSPNDDDNGNASGSAYLYEQNTGGSNNWGEVKKLLPSDGGIRDYFGNSVSIDNDIVIIGSRGDDFGPSNVDFGSTFIFREDAGGSANWGEVLKLSASDGTTSDNFGLSVSIEGENVIISTGTNSPTFSPGNGSIYFFERQAIGIDNWSEDIKFSYSDPASLDYFGISVDVSGDVAIVGASLDDDNGFESGAAYLFGKDVGGTDNWGLIKKLLASDGTSDDRFGNSVSISGSTVIVGAFRDSDIETDNGSAYIFSQNTGGINNWGQAKKLVPGNNTFRTKFGSSVSISGNMAVVGTPNDNINGVESGSAYIFSRDMGGSNSWGQVKQLTNSDNGFDQRFGGSVSIDSDMVIVGAPDHDAAYLYGQNAGGINNWGEVKKVVNNIISDSNFGTSVSISNDLVIVGAPGDDDINFNSGSAVLFDRNFGGANNWGLLKKLVASDGGEFNHQFGHSVSIDNHIAIVGSSWDGGSNEPTFENGTAYIFIKDEGGLNNWGEKDKLLASDGNDDDLFGQSVAISNDVIVIGAPEDDDIGSTSGSAYIFGQSNCLTSMTITANPIPDNIYQVSQNIISTGKVPTNGNVQFLANTICLNNNFEVALNGVFEALINPCSN